MDSVIHQDYPNFEYIIIDGGSTDGSVQLIQEKQDIFGDNFLWKSEPDSGIYHAMNKGIRMSSGEYLLFLNSGDILVHENVLGVVFNVTRESDILAGRCRVSEKGEAIHTTNPPDKITFGELYFKGLAHQSTFIKKELFRNLGYYSEDLKINGDREFWVRSLILNRCSYEKLNIIISEYDKGGISTQMLVSEQYKHEMEDIYARAGLELFVPDYISWAEEKSKMKVLYWVYYKPLIYNLVKGIYRLARNYSRMRKSICAG